MIIFDLVRFKKNNQTDLKKPKPVIDLFRFGFFRTKTGLNRFDLFFWFGSVFLV
jgi:hypothetical protein